MSLKCYWLVCALISLHCPGRSSLRVELPDLFGRKSSRCCKQTAGCQSVVASQCTKTLCNCDTVDLDFSVSGLVPTARSFVNELAASIAVSPDGNLMVVAGKGGGWVSKSTTLYEALYDTTAKYVITAQDSTDSYITVAAGNDLVCFSMRSRVQCVWQSTQPDGSGTMWRDVLNYNLPEAWAIQWGERNFLINTKVFETEWCPQVCDACFTKKFGTLYLGYDSPYPCYGEALSIDGTSLAITGRQHSRTTPSGQQIFKGFLQIRTAEQLSDGRCAPGVPTSRLISS